MSEGALGMLIGKYKKILKKCGLLNTLAAMALAGAIGVGSVSAMAADSITISDNHQVADNINETFGNIDIASGGSLDIARRGKVTGDAVVVSQGGSLTSAGHIHVGNFQVGNSGSTPNTGLVATSLATSGSVTSADLGFGYNGKVTVTGGDMTVGAINFGNSDNAGILEIKGGEFIVDNLSMRTDKLVENPGTTAIATIGLNGSGELTVNDTLKLMGGDYTSTFGPSTFLHVGKLQMDEGATWTQATGTLHLKKNGGGDVFSGSMLYQDGGNVVIGSRNRPTEKHTFTPEFYLYGGNLTTYGAVDMANLRQNHGTANISQDSILNLGTIDMEDMDGRINVNGKLAVTKAFNWAGQLAINSGGEVDITTQATAHGWDGGSLDNKGTLIINGNVNLDSGFQVNTPGTIHVFAEGNKAAGVNISDKETFDALRKGSLILGGANGSQTAKDTSFIGVNIPLTFAASDFVGINDASAGKIAIGDYGRINVNNSVTIDGDNLAVGDTKYALPYNSRMGDIKAYNIFLNPNGDTFTLAAGSLYATGSPNGNSGNNVVSIKDGNGTLHVDGGRLRLGSVFGGDAQFSKGGYIAGNIIVGNNTQTTDSSMKVAYGNWTVTGDLTINKSGYLDISSIDPENPGAVTKDLVLNVSKKFALNGGTILIDSGAALNPKITAGNADTVITVGGDSSGTFTSESIKMEGGAINLDPPFGVAGDLANVTLAGLRFESDSMDARINIGRNSMLTLGSSDTSWLTARIAEYQNAGMGTWGVGITSALGIRSPQTLAAIGGINVDGNWTQGGNPAAVNTARFAAKSLLVIDADSLGGKTALSGNGSGTLTVEPDARLLVSGGKVDQDVVVTADFSKAEISEAGWSANLATNTPLMAATGEELANGNYIVHLNRAGWGKDIFTGLSSELADVVDQAFIDGLNVDSSARGLSFISRAVDNDYIGKNNPALAAATIESAARMAVIGAVPQITLAANSAAGTAITQRTSLALPDAGLQSVDANGNINQDQAIHGKGFALWLMPLFQSANGFGMEAGNFDYDFSGNLGGVALGADYTFDNAIRAGISFNIGGGYAQGTGDLNKTTNNMDFWGIGAYLGWSANNFGLTADINFTSTYNKLKQELPASMQMEDLKSDITAWAISTGLRAEYKFNTDFMDIIPHVGFRYINLNTDSYDINSGGTVVEGDSFTQNIWTFPVGVSFSKSMDLNNGWHIKPLLDLNITPATGDIKAKTKVRFTGTASEAEIDTKMMDYVTYGGTAGIEFGNDSVSVGINYHGQFGAESSAHGVFGMFRYEF